MCFAIVFDMGYQQAFYILSLSFQLSGALILILFCWGDTRRRILNMVYPANTSIPRDDNNNVEISKEKLYRAHKEVLNNRIAFIFLGCGYLLSVFGTNEGINKWCIFWGVVFVSVMLTMSEAGIAHFVAKFCNKNNRIYSYDELCGMIDVDVDTNSTKYEIDELIKD